MMCLFKDHIENIFFPCQKKLDSVIAENSAAWDALHDAIKEKKETLIKTKFPEFRIMAGRRHVNPR